LLEAMLRAFGWLVSNVVSMLATIFNRPTRDWHTDDAHEDQLPTPNDKQQETQRTCSVILGLVPRIPVGWARELGEFHTGDSQDSRDKPESDSI